VQFIIRRRAFHERCDSRSDRDALVSPVPRGILSQEDCHSYRHYKKNASSSPRWRTLAMLSSTAFSCLFKYTAVIPAPEAPW
jgi:hypothetical protein